MTEHTLRVRFAETDRMGIVHHSRWAVWLEAARVEWLRERGLSYRDLEDSGVSLAVSSLTLRYLAPARFDDEVAVQATLEEARSRRFRFSYRVLLLPERKLLAEGTTVHIPVDENGRALRLPAAWRARLGNAGGSGH
ncbi:MAG TPA: thioesterase family protein [Deinococcales bacterium]|nr:thioesterase family protein [Deinococcales bacterium]